MIDEFILISLWKIPPPNPKRLPWGAAAARKRFPKRASLKTNLSTRSLPVNNRALFQDDTLIFAEISPPNFIFKFEAKVLIWDKSTFLISILRLSFPEKEKTPLTFIWLRSDLRVTLSKTKSLFWRWIRWFSLKVHLREFT